MSLVMSSELGGGVVSAAASSIGFEGSGGAGMSRVMSSELGGGVVSAAASSIGFGGSGGAGMSLAMSAELGGGGGGSEAAIMIGLGGSTFVVSASGGLADATATGGSGLVSGLAGGALSRRATASFSDAYNSLVGSPVSRWALMRWKVRMAARVMGPNAPSGLSRRSLRSKSAFWTIRT
ncbi:hypothetical protein [Reyranella sp.]|uniref:hypothetical protein n=1 Tax=Reyranella sp. TaxID=1929291 RepID=UPI00271AD705|nr:hypothetical protein [Reyranella sp.]MDO8974991.1 hypothetical protein [Reyranella sp.]